jgi:hypothetical protein
MQYVPQVGGSPSTLPTNLAEFEGPAVGYCETGRGREYTYKVPSNVLNAMGLNYYSTRTNVSPAQDPDTITQGLMVFLNSTPATPIIAYLHVKYEFQTLEDPSFLANLFDKQSEDSSLMVVPRMVRAHEGTPIPETKTGAW